MIKFVITFIQSKLIFTKKSINPVKWRFTAKKIGFNSYKIYLTAFIFHPWRIYSQESSTEGPLPTIIKFEENAYLSMTGKVEELGRIIEEYEVGFQANTKYYDTVVAFVQDVTIFDQPVLVKGKIIYMVSNKKNT